MLVLQISEDPAPGTRGTMADAPALTRNRSRMEKSMSFLVASKGRGTCKVVVEQPAILTIVNGERIHFIWLCNMYLKVYRLPITIDAQTLTATYTYKEE